MSQLGTPPSSKQDDRLAEFTDQLLTGRINQAGAEADEELVALEETILRLKNAFPPAPLDTSTVKQMQVRFNARVRREAQETKIPFWKKWLEPKPRLLYATAFAAMAFLVVFAVLSPLSTTVGSSTPATALNLSGGIVAVVMVAGMILVFLLIKRRK